MTDSNKLLRLATVVMAVDIAFIVIGGFVASSAHTQHIVDIVAAVVFCIALIPGFIHLARTFGPQGDRARIVNIAIPLVLAAAAALALWLMNGWSGGGPLFGAVFVFALYQVIANGHRRRRKNVA